MSFTATIVETDLDGNLLAVHPTGCGRVIVEKTSD